MTEANRSLSACLRCRRQKLKCGGPGKVPCQRCQSSRSECVFVPPRAGHAGSAASDIDAKTALLEKRLESMERQLRLEIESVRAEVARVSPYSSNLRQGLSPQPAPVALLTAEKDAQSSSTGTDEWDELYAFFCTNCSAIVAVIDDQLHSPAETVRKHPLMSAVICAVASKAVCPVRHQSYVSEVDRLIMKTFKGPMSDLIGVQAMILFAAWSGRTRLMGYIASVATELKLHEAAVLIGDETIEHTPDLIGRARTWFTLCCLDLQTNISRPFVINNMREYLQYAKYLVMSPYHRPVDERICTYIKGFTIAGNVKGQLKNSQLKSKPLLPGVAKLLASSDEQVDQWFHETNNNIHPLYQTFPDRQDRNRFLMPFAFMKLYINGLALQGVESADDLNSDPTRIEFIQRALNSASLIIQTQHESQAFRRSFQYTMDYFGIPTYYAISFILKALPLVCPFMDCQQPLTRVRQAAQMFEQAGALDAANEIRRDVERTASVTQTVLSPEPVENFSADLAPDGLFDISNFLDDMAWDANFPALGMFPSG